MTQGYSLRDCMTQETTKVNKNGLEQAVGGEVPSSHNDVLMTYIARQFLSNTAESNHGSTQARIMFPHEQLHACTCVVPLLDREKVISVYRRYLDNV